MLKSKLASMRSTVRATGDKGESDVVVLFDTGAGVSFILRSVAEKLCTLSKLPKPFSITLGDNSSLEITEQAVINVDAAGENILDNFLVLEESVADVILGESTMRKYGLKIDMERNVIFCALKATPINHPKEPPMWKKFLSALGIAVDDENLTEEQAQELLKNKLATKGGQPEPKTPASAAIAAALQLEPGTSEDEAIAAIMVLQQRTETHPVERFEQLSENLREREVLAVVETACRPGPGDMEGKLYPRQKDWALEQARANLDAFKIFVAKAPKVLAVFDKLPGKKSSPVIDAQQEAINRQIGLPKETFQKYAH